MDDSQNPYTKEAVESRIAEAKAIAWTWLNNGDYNTSWNLSVTYVSFDYRESDDRVELSFYSDRWEFVSSEEDAIKERDLEIFMQWAENVEYTVIAQDNNHPSNVLNLSIADNEVQECG